MSSVVHYSIGALGSPQSHVIQTFIDDISTASSSWVGSLPFDYEVEDAQITLYGAITVADANITLEVNGTAIDGCAAVVPFTGSAAGATTAFSLPSGGVTNEIAEDDAIEVITDGASTGVVKAIVNITCRRRA